jgi:hypothetical protein
LLWGECEGEEERANFRLGFYDASRCLWGTSLLRRKAETTESDWQGKKWKMVEADFKAPKLQRQFRSQQNQFQKAACSH